MSDPVKNVEIEDVLSSIRRLVTEEGRENPKSGAKPAQPVGRLVLTPSLRVPDASEAEADEQDAPEDASSDRGEVLTLGHDVRSVSFADEIEFRRDASRLRGEAAARADAPPAAFEAKKPASGEFAEDRTPWKRPDATLHAAATQVTEPTDDSPEDIIAPKAVATDPAQQAASMRSATLSAKIKALEAAIAERAEKWEPDGSTEEVFDSSGHAPMAWRDAAEDDKQPATIPEAEDLQAEETLPEPEPEPEAEVVDMDASDDTVMDEEALRELVAEIVRQELRGALGERITRNVRKLVRREIQRALASQALE